MSTEITKNIKNQERKAQIASLIGATIEYYDYFLYGILASIVFNKLFFPTFDPVVGLLLSLASFGIPYFMRPLGSVYFGHIGDKEGRRKALMITLLLMGAATVGIGILPVYDTIGVWAPIFLVGLRLIQGFAVGGEWGGAVLVASENTEESSKAFGASIALVGASLGMFLGTITVSLLTLMPNETFMAWGWRLPFIGSIVLIIFGYWMRIGLEESEEFQEIQEEEETVKIPIVETIRYHWRNVLLAAVAKGLEGAPFYLFATFVVVFATEYNNMSETLVLLAVSAGTIASVIFIPIWAKMADRIGVKPMFRYAAIALILFLAPYFIMLSTGSIAFMFVAVILSWIVYAMSGGSLGGLFIELFDANVRMTGISTGYQLGAAVFGGLTPLVSVALIEMFGSWIAVAVVMAIIAVLAIISTYMMKSSSDDFEKEDLEKENIAVKES